MSEERGQRHELERLFPNAAKIYPAKIAHLQVIFEEFPDAARVAAKQLEERARQELERNSLREQIHDVVKKIASEKKLETITITYNYVLDELELSYRYLQKQVADTTANSSEEKKAPAPPRMSEKEAERELQKLGLQPVRVKSAPTRHKPYRVIYQGKAFTAHKKVELLQKVKAHLQGS